MTVHVLLSNYTGKTGYQSPEVSLGSDAFDASKNDVWCFGVCLFMLVTGSAPYVRSVEDDGYFKMMMQGKSGIKELLAKWDKAHYVDDALLELFGAIFQYEADRVDLEGLKSCTWLCKE